MYKPDNYHVRDGGGREEVLLLSYQKINMLEEKEEGRVAIRDHFATFIMIGRENGK